MRKILISSICVGALLLASCSVKAPVAVTSNKIGSKTGVASRTVFFNLWFGTTDISLKTAAKNGNITKIATVDSKSEVGFLGLKKTVSTIVTGE